MDQNHLIDWIGIVLALAFGMTMFYHGHAIFHGKNGYKHAEREKHKSAVTRKTYREIAQR